MQDNEYIEEFSKLENPPEDQPEGEESGENLELQQEGPSRDEAGSQEGLEGISEEERAKLRADAENDIDFVQGELNEERAGLGIPESDEIPPSVQGQMEILDSLNAVEQKRQEGGGVDDEEKGPETIATMEEIRSVFEQLVEGGVWEDLRLMEDEKGPYLWEIKAGEAVYEYMRKGSHEEGFNTGNSVIDVIYFEDGMPVSGDKVAEYVNGGWQGVLH